MIEVECFISIKKDGISFLSPIKTLLLYEIKRSGSLKGAANNLKISYQHAWNMIDEMNSIAPEPIILKQRGGVNGGGAEISKYGEHLLNEYRQIENLITKMVRKINMEINL